MQLVQAFTRSAGAVAVLLSSTALVQAADVSFLTHWAPDTVAKLEAAAATYTEAHPDTKITVRAVPFGDLLTTLRSSGGGAGGATIAGIYDAWLPDLSKDQLVERLCEWGEEVSNNAIEVYIHRLRKKIEQGPIRIATVRGLGYCLEKIAS